MQPLAAQPAACLSSSKAGSHSLIPLNQGLGVLGIVLQAQIVQAAWQVLCAQPCSFQAALVPAQQADKACTAQSAVRLAQQYAHARGGQHTCRLASTILDLTHMTLASKEHVKVSTKPCEQGLCLAACYGRWA